MANPHDVLLWCPACLGKCGFVGVFPIYVKGVRAEDRKPAIEIPCNLCDSKGTISRNQLANWAYGQRIRLYREDVLKLGLREAAKLWNIKPSVLSGMEQGTVDNSGWYPGIENGSLC